MRPSTYLSFWSPPPPLYHSGASFIVSFRCKTIVFHPLSPTIQASEKRDYFVGYLNMKRFWVIDHWLFLCISLHQFDWTIMTRVNICDVEGQMARQNLQKLFAFCYFSFIRTAGFLFNSNNYGYIHTAGQIQILFAHMRPVSDFFMTV